MAALVQEFSAERTALTLVNLSPFEERRLTVRAGAFGEHRFGRAAWDRDDTHL